jgi:hypothetical protein
VAAQELELSLQVAMAQCCVCLALVFSHILPGFPVAEGSWQRWVFAAGDSRSIPQGAHASSRDADWHHVPPYLLP